MRKSLTGIGLISIASVSAIALWQAADGTHPVDIHRISTEDDFARLAIALPLSGEQEIKRVPFIIDLQSHETPVIWMDANETEFHYEYLTERGLTHLPVEEFNHLNYTSDERRFVLGSVVRYGPGRDVVELWDGDTITGDRLALTMDRLGRAYHRRLLFRPGSPHQQSVAEAISLPIDDGPGIADGRFVFNEGRSIGTLRLIETDDQDDVLPSDIVILTRTPIDLDPVGGIISMNTVSPTTHINVLSRTWGIPNVQDPSAGIRFADLIGRKVVFEAKGASYSIRAATDREIAHDDGDRKKRAPLVPQADLTNDRMAALSDQDRADSLAYGAKSANLGFLFSLLPEAGGAYRVPDGFTIPFSYYERHLRESGLDAEIDELLADATIRNDRRALKVELARLRRAFLDRPVSPEVLRRISTRRQTVLGDAGMFVRSSTNAEDLPGFSGAGLYDTVPNVVTDEDLAKAVKQVWGSIWNDAAFLSREAAGIDHRAVKAAVIVQRGIDADAAGVMLTRNAYSSDGTNGILISAKKGLGIRVVQGRRMPEQAIYRFDEDSESIDLLSLSEDDVLLEFDRDGGLRERGTRVGERVLDDGMHLRLGRIARRVEERYREPVDIEWLVVGDEIHLVQVRPYRTSSR